MSRRKQSNPKPIKRPEDEDEDGDMPAKTNQSEGDLDVVSDQSDSSSETETRNEPMESLDADLQEKDMDSPDDKGHMNTDSDNLVKTEPSEEIFIKTEPCDSVPQKDLEMSPRRQEMMAKLRFPSDLLTLRKVEESEFQHTGIPWSVSSAVPMAKGSTIGPYQGELVALSSIKPRELVLQFQGGDGDFSFIKVMEQSGAWLSLLKPGEHNSAHNTQVSFEGGNIWCEIVEELKQGTELVASFTTKAGHKSPTSAGSPAIKSAEQQVKETRPQAGKKLDTKTGSQLSPQHALIYGCPFCGVRFSSRRTLDAHLTYYCSKKPPDFVSLQQLHQHLQQQAQSLLEKQLENQSKKENGLASPRIKTEPEPSKGAKRTVDDAGLESSDSSLDAEAPRHKSPKSGEVFKCLTCGYVTEKLSSFQRHRLAHSQQEDGGATTPERVSVSPVCQEEAFCKECNIQFSSISTYRGHKEFYCRSELAKHSNGGEDLEGASPTNLRQLGSDLSPKLLKSPPILLEKNGHLAASKARIPPEMLATNLLNSPLLLQAMTADMQLYLQQHPSMEALSAIKLENKKCDDENKAGDDQPLDLSKSKSDKEDSSGDKGMDTDGSSTEPDRNAVVKTEPGSPSQHSPEMKKLKTEDEKLREPSGSPLRPPLNIPTVHPTLLAGTQIQYVNKKPIPPLQNVSRCVECNIVFYKHENYLIHKEHYCSGRRTSKDTASESDKSDNEGKETDIVTPLSSSGLNMKSRSESGSKISPVADQGQGEIKHADIPPESVPATKPDVCLKYFCFPCKIRFSSAGTLKAHKDFYCPHGKENSMNVMVKDPADNDSGEKSPKLDSNYRCDTCRNEFFSARLLKLHICMAEVSPAPLQRCLYCDYVTQTENRLSEHMKVHIPTKAFKCNLCGYRGNTARGMRMHGKTHMENGEEFTDENMIEYEEPPLVPIQRNGVCEKGPVDVETELIRMKNEPYKRRRSRKSFEKSENMVPLIGPNLLTQICAACGQTFSNINEFVIHLKMHEIAALEAMKSLRCEHCSDYIADSLTSLLVHMQTKHPEQLPGTSRNDNEATSGSEGERSKSRESQVSNDRSRSNSVESSRMSHSSQDDRGDFVSRSPDSKNSNWSRDSSHLESDRNSSEIQRITNDNVFRVKQEVGNEGDEKLIEGNRSIKVENDLVQNHKSQVIETSSHSPQESIRSPITPNIPSERVSIPQAVSPKSPSPPHDSHVHRSPRRPSSPSDSVKSKSPTLSQNNVPQHVRDTVVSPKIESIRQENLLSPKRLSPDPKTRYLMSQNSTVIKQEQMSPPSDKSQRKATPPASPHTPRASPKLLTGHSSPSSIHPPLSLLYNPQSLLPLYQFPAGIPGLIPTPDLQPSPPHSSTGEKHGRKYCKHCDINFTYLSSFLTHKKYYCSARNAAEDAQSPTATA